MVWNSVIIFISVQIVVDSEDESTESDDEFQICNICNSEEVCSLSFSSLFYIVCFIFTFCTIIFLPCRKGRNCFNVPVVASLYILTVWFHLSWKKYLVTGLVIHARKKQTNISKQDMPMWQNC